MERQTITVDIAPGNNQIQRLKSSQGDIGRPLGVYIIQNGAALDCSAYTADLYILKPDGNYFTATATVDATEHNLITWETAKQETPVAGDCAAQIRILSNGDDVGTARFVEYVEASPGFVGESSESVVESLMEYVRQAAASAETASGAASSASGSASAASGSASSAASSASAAAGSASTAHTDAETASQAAQTAQDVADSIPEDYSTLSEDVTGLKSALNKMPYIASREDDEDADLYLADQSGNGILRLANGYLQTKWFNSDQSIFKKTFSYDNTAGTETIMHFFPKGTELVLHMVNNAAIGADSIANKKVTYFYTDHNNVSHEIGSEYGYNFLRYILPADAVSVSVDYGTSMLWGSSGTLAFSVIVEPSYSRKPIIVTLDANGGKDYTSLRSAVEAINTKASEATPYEIHIYPGTYNVLNDFSADEISASGFCGLMITNGISLIGIGQREHIIIHGEVSAETYDATKRNDISTLNVQGNVRIENLTITAKNIRYAIHDDYVTMTYRISDAHIYKNLKLYGTDLTTGEIVFGAGGGNIRKLIVSDCDFNGTFLVHNSTNNVVSYQVYVTNCSATKFSFPDYDAVTPTYVYLRNCKTMFILEGMIGDSHAQSLFIEGEGTYGAFINCPAGYVYNTGDCRRIRASQIATGYAVKAAWTGYHAGHPHISVTTDIGSIYGISLGNDGSDTVVQVSGYINSNTLGLSNLSVGDYLTINSSGEVVSGGTASNAVAKVVYVDENSVAYAKLTI